MITLLLSFFISLSAQADWESNFTATSSKDEFPKISGKFYSKLDRVRIDTPYPFQMSVYAKTGSNRVYAAVHSFKIRLSSKAETFSAQLPACLSKQFERCVKELKLRKIGQEKCGDRDCEVFEGTPKLRGMKKIKLWHWVGEKEPIFAKTILTQPNGAEIHTAFSEITRKTHPDSFFSVPPKYKDAGSLESFFGDMKGKSP